MADKDRYLLIRHELRTSLNHIIGYCEILQTDIKEFDWYEFIPGLKRINNEAEKLEDMISSYFDPDLEEFDSIEKETLRKTLFVPIYEIIGAAQEVKVLLEERKVPHFISDIEKILSAAELMLSIIDKFSKGNGYGTKTVQNESIQLKLFPLATEDVRKTAARTEQEGQLLVVDDNELNRDMISRHLERFGYTVYTAKNGADALEKLETYPIDLILLDILLPLINGYAILKQVKADYRYNHIPVIIMSALDEMDLAIKCIEMGADDYLPRSFDPVLMFTRISASLEKKRLRDKEKTYIDAIIQSQQVLASELAEAAEYVRSLLPPPLEGAVKSRWLFIPSTQLGGDCFGFHWLDKEQLALYLLDVSGHGIGAALLSVSVASVLRTQSLQNTNFHIPGEVLTALNKAFPMENQNNMYFSIWYGIYNRKKALLKYASAGAPPALLISQDKIEKKKILKLTTPDMIIGVSPETTYTTVSTEVLPLNRLYLFSDGIFEIRTPEGKMLEFETFLDVLWKQSSSTGFTTEKVLNAMQDRAKNHRFDDDVSLLEFIF